MPDGNKVIGTGPRTRATDHVLDSAWFLYDAFDNMTYGYRGTRVQTPAQNVFMQFKDQTGGSFLSTSPDVAGYELTTSWNNDPDWPTGNFPASVFVDYPADPDWAAGTVTKNFTYVFETSQSHALIKYFFYDRKKSDGTQGISEDSGEGYYPDRPFPMMVQRNVASDRMPKTSAGDGPRLALLAVVGDHVSAEVPKPEPISTGSRYWSSDTPPANLIRVGPQPKLEVQTPSPFRLTLIDDNQNVVTDGEFLAHLCPRFDHEPNRGVGCSFAPVRSVNGVISSITVNPFGSGEASRGYLAFELTKSPNAKGFIYVKVESLDQNYRIRRQSDFVTGSDITTGEFQPGQLRPLRDPTLATP